MNYKNIQIVFFISILLITLGITLLIFKPYFNAVIFALALAVIFRPIYNWLLKRLKTPPSLAALIMVFLVFAIILIPLVLIGLVMVREASSLYTYLIVGEQGHVLLDKIQLFITELVPGANLNLINFFSDFAGQTLNFVIDNLGEVFSNAIDVIVSFILLLFALYYVLKDGSRLKKAMIVFSPLADKYDKQIIKKLVVAVNSVIKGEILIAIIQGILSGIGFWIFGVPNPVLLGAFTAIAALVPAVGVLIVFVPSILYLFLTAGLGNWLGLALWGLLLVGTIDNFLRPKLIERGIKIHPLLIFLSVIGGISLFGPFGFLIGPLVLSLLFALLDIYKEEFKDYLK